MTGNEWSSGPTILEGENTLGHVPASGDGCTGNGESA